MVALKDYTFIKIEDCINPNKSGSYDLIMNHYWIVTPDNCIVMYKKYSLQCNSQKACVDRLLKITKSGANRVELIEKIFIPHDCGY